MKAIIINVPEDLKHEPYTSHRVKFKEVIYDEVQTPVLVYEYIEELNTDTEYYFGHE